MLNIIRRRIKKSLPLIDPQGTYVVYYSSGSHHATRSFILRGTYIFHIGPRRVSDICVEITSRPRYSTHELTLMYRVALISFIRVPRNNIVQICLRFYFHRLRPTDFRRYRGKKKKLNRLINCTLCIGSIKLLTRIRENGLVFARARRNELLRNFG